MRGYRQVALLGLVMGFSFIFAVSVYKDVQAFDGEEGRLIGLINQYRQANGLAPLSESASLDGAALQHSQEMAASCSMYHGNYLAAGASEENVAWNQPSAEAVLNIWMSSPAHNANMLNPRFTSIGTGHAAGECGPYWTAMFA